MDRAALAADLRQSFTSISTADTATGLVDECISIVKGALEEHAPLCRLRDKNDDEKQWYTEEIHMARRQ